MIKSSCEVAVQASIGASEGGIQNWALLAILPRVCFQRRSRGAAGGLIHVHMVTAVVER